MALSASTVIEIRADGADTNGGGYVSGGTDHSQQAAAQYAVTDGVTNGTTTITSATANFGTDVVGNLIYVTGGTGSVVAAWYQIITRTSATAIVVDRTTGLTAGTGVTLNIGGALASIGQLGKLIADSGVAGMRVYIRGAAGTITLTTATPNISGGPFSLATASTASTRITGYTTTRGDNGYPTISTGAVTTVKVFEGNGGTTNRLLWVEYIKVDGVNVANTTTGFANTDANPRGSHFWKCQAINCTTGFHLPAIASSCYAESCTTGFVLINAQSSAVKCRAKSCGTGFNSAGGPNVGAVLCVAEGCSGDGFAGGNAQKLYGCTSYSNGGDGFDLATTNGRGHGCIACVAYGNTGVGFRCDSAGLEAFLWLCAAGSNSAPTAGSFLVEDVTALSGNPFVDAASGDFRPDATTNEGALLRALGVQMFDGFDNTDIGAVQHADPAGGSANTGLHQGHLGQTGIGAF